MQQREWVSEIWFCFGQPLTSARSTRNSVESPLRDPMGNCTPGDELSSERIKNLHLKMESRRLQYATRFSPVLRNLIRSIEKL